MQLALADWYQWHHFYAEALQKYREAWGMMAGGTHAYKYLHDMRFRPRFVNGKAVTTQALERNYTIHY